LNLNDKSLSHVGAKALAEMLKGNCFSENRLGIKGVESIGEMLSENIALQSLGVARDIHKLLTPSRIQLRVLNPKGNELGDEGAMIVGSFISCNSLLEDLDLSWNAIHLRGVAALAKGLKANASLQSLYLSMNSILNEGAVKIGEVLAINRSLKVLDVSNCAFNSFLSVKTGQIDHIFSLFIFSAGIYSNVESYSSFERAVNKLSKKNFFFA